MTDISFDFAKDYFSCHLSNVSSRVLCGFEKVKLSMATLKVEGMMRKNVVCLPFTPILLLHHQLHSTLTFFRIISYFYYFQPFG